jgi:hypothetical protein
MNSDFSPAFAQLAAHEALLEILYANWLTDAPIDDRERVLANLVDRAQRAMYSAAAATSRSDRPALKGQREAIALIERFVDQVRRQMAEAPPK